MNKPILCLDFDGVIHSYSSGWKGADNIPDPPVAGAMDFIRRALEHFKVAVYSSRSGQPDGIYAMRKWLRRHWLEEGLAGDLEMEIEWPTEKPAALITIDDRAITFDGTWPSIDELKAFQPWNKRPFGATGTFPQGVLNDDDQGAIKIGITFDKKDGLVHLDFGKPVAWAAFPPEMAAQLARMLLKHAGAKTVEISF